MEAVAALITAGDVDSGRCAMGDPHVLAAAFERNTSRSSNAKRMLTDAAAP